MDAQHTWTQRADRMRAGFLAFAQALRRFPWGTTLATLRVRFREDQLGLTASSLTFTTMVALVPLFTVLLSVFTAFPMFAKLQSGLQVWLIDSLIPDQIGQQVDRYLVQFASKASRLGWVSFVALIVTAVALILTIDKTLNRIWRVRRPRPLAQRVLVYWAGLTLGPLVLAASMATTGYVISLSLRLVDDKYLKGLFLLSDVVEIGLLAAGATAMFRYMPNTRVRWAHAAVGGLWVALGFQCAKWALAAYLKAVPVYASVYGAFAVVPILLVWIYIAWLIVLLGAVVAAYLPALLLGVERRGGAPGWQFQLAVEVLHELDRARQDGQGHLANRAPDEANAPVRGLNAQALGERLHVDPLQLEHAFETLCQLDWIAPLAEEESRYVLLCDVAQTPVEPLAALLLLANADLRKKTIKIGTLSNIHGNSLLH